MAGEQSFIADWIKGFVCNSPRCMKMKEYNNRSVAVTAKMKTLMQASKPHLKKSDRYVYIILFKHAWCKLTTWQD